MSENTPGARRDDAVDQNDTTQELDALRQEADAETPEPTPAGDETQVLAPGTVDAETQILSPAPASAPAGDETQELHALRHGVDTPGLETQPEPGQTRVLPTVGPDDPLSIFDQPSSSSWSAPAPASTVPLAEPATPVSAAGYGRGSSSTAPAAPQPAWTPPPAPLVRTTPRSSTIVWGFVILAIGIGVLSVVAGATLDVGLAMIWLLAAAGAVLIVSSIAGAARRRRKAT